MPRGHNSKLRAREKRQARRQSQGQGAALASQAKESAVSENHSVAGAHSSPQSGAAAACGDECEGTNNPGSLQTGESEFTDPLHPVVVSLVRFLMEKYLNRELITKADMLKCVIKRHKQQFNEILKRATEYMELAFCVDLKEIDALRHRYTFITKLSLTANEMVFDTDNAPKTGLLMIVLAVIFMKGKSATEEEVWSMLNMMGIYADQSHFIYGDPKKIITQDLVDLKYLEYRQVPDSDPPLYEFLWGPRAQAETSKMQVLEFLAKIHNKDPSAFPDWYEEAVKDEDNRLRARIEARSHHGAMARARAMARAQAKATPSFSPAQSKI